VRCPFPPDLQELSLLSAFRNSKVFTASFFSTRDALGSSSFDPSFSPFFRNGTLFLGSNIRARFSFGCNGVSQAIPGPHFAIRRKHLSFLRRCASSVPPFFTIRAEDTFFFFSSFAPSEAQSDSLGADCWTSLFCRPAKTSFSFPKASRCGAFPI